MSTLETGRGTGSSGGEGRLPHNTAEFLARHIIGTVCARVLKLTLAQPGDIFEISGIDMLLKSTTNNGWVTSATSFVTLENSADESTISKANSTDPKFRVVDRNHRVAALTFVDERDPADTIFDVQVYRALGERAECVIATSE